MRAETRSRILAAARSEIAEHGGVGLSMRAIAREVGLVSSAIYRHFPTREALITAMILESYANLDAALSAAPHDRRPDRRWTALANALREWARAHPHEFQLIYGTPIPGYVAPPETVPAAAAVASPFIEVGTQPVDAFTDPDLVEQLAGLAEPLGADPSGAAAVVAELAALVGFITLELGGHFVGVAEPAEPLFRALVARQAATLGLFGLAEYAIPPRPRLRAEPGQ